MESNNNSELESLISEVKSLKERLNSLRPLNPTTIAKGFQELRMRMNYHTNALEGNSLDYGETRLLLMYGLTAKGKPLKDHLDIKGHNEAFLWLEDFAQKKFPLTQGDIRELHKVLLREPYYVDAETPSGEPTRKLIEVGKYKTTPNNVKTSTGEIFYFADPVEVNARMTDLMDRYNEYENLPESDKDPIRFAAEFHYKFIIIHPFDDGNGRMARILMNLILMRASYPPAIIQKEERDQYLLALETADQNKDQPDLTAFIYEVAKGLKYSLELLVKSAEGLKTEEIEKENREMRLVLIRQARETNTQDIKQKVKDLWERNLLPFYEELIITLTPFIEEFVKVGYQGPHGVVNSVKDFNFLTNNWSTLYDNLDQYPVAQLIFSFSQALLPVTAETFSIRVFITLRHQRSGLQIEIERQGDGSASHLRDRKSEELKFNAFEMNQEICNQIISYIINSILKEFERSLEMNPSANME